MLDLSIDVLTLDGILIELEKNDLVRNNDPDYCQFVYEQALLERMVVCDVCGESKPSPEFSQYRFSQLYYYKPLMNKCNVCHNRGN